RHTRSKRDWSSDVCSSDLLPRRPRRPGPVDGSTDQVGSAQCGAADPLGELKVVADDDGDAPVLGLDDRWSSLTGGEDRPFGIPEVDFAVDDGIAARNEKCRTVEGSAVFVGLAEPGHDDRV